MGIEQRLLQLVTQNFKELEKTCNKLLQDPNRRPLSTSLWSNQLTQTEREGQRLVSQAMQRFKLATSSAELNHDPTYNPRQTRLGSGSHLNNVLGENHLLLPNGRRIAR